MTLSPEQKKLLSRIASRLLNLRSGTPIATLRKSLGPQRTLLDDMVTGNFIRILGDQYLPTFRGIEQLDDDIRSLVRGTLNCVLGAFKRLYSRSDENIFNFALIVEETRRQNPSLDANDVLPALLLGEQFSHYYSLNGIHQRDDHLVVEAAMVVERILDFTVVEDDWAKLIAQEEADKSRRVKAKARVVGPTLTSRGQEVGLPDLQFMRRADLKNIVERDYLELQRVRSVGAAKSRYVLCGGLIEALLLDALSGEEAKAKTAKKSPKSKGGSEAKALLDWNLGELIDVAVELRIIETDAQQFSHGVRNFRNLVHPGKEIQSQQKVATEEADISEKVLEIIIRELRQKHP